MSSHDSYFIKGADTFYLAHGELKPGAKTIVFIHGLGDSGINFHDLFYAKELADFNILIPDLLGYGRSSASDSYAFEKQANGIIEHIDYLQSQHDMDFSSIILATHSMGGVYGTLLCQSRLKDKIKGFVNVEGSVTQFGSFISQKVAGLKQPGSFDRWFLQVTHEGLNKKLKDDDVALRRYNAAMIFCRKDAFKQNALELYAMSRKLEGEFTNLAGKMFADLELPKVYCYGDTMSERSLAFLDAHQIDKKYFPSPTHFVVNECFDAVVTFVAEFVKNNG